MPFLPAESYFAERKKQLADIPYGEVWQMIHRGSMTKLWENPDFDWQMFYLLKPYSNNITKRAVKTPKLYFLDTGLAAYLTKWNTVDVLKNGAMAGAFFESFVISEIIKSYYKRIFWPFDLLDRIPGVRRGPGGLVCLYDTLISFRGNDCVIPVQYL